MPQVGESISYVFSIQNTGLNTITNISISDPLLTVLGSPIASLAPGFIDNSSFSGTYTITQSDINNGQVSNQATVTGLGPGNNSVEDLSDDDSYLENDPTITILPLQLNIFVFLEGSLIDPQTGNYQNNMSTRLNDSRLLPGQLLVDPFGSNIYSPILGHSGGIFNILPWNYSGSEGQNFDSQMLPANADAGYPSSVVSWILVSLRNNPNDGDEFLCQRAALLHGDGSIQFVANGNLCDLDRSQSYHVIIEHPSHLIAMSDSAVNVIDGAISYDFRNRQSYINDPFMGGSFAGQKEVLPGIFSLYAGNGDQSSTNDEDTDLTAADYLLWLNNGPQIKSNFIRADYNMDGSIDALDFILFIRNSPLTTTVLRN